jgi:hypothetical protein
MRDLIDKLTEIEDTGDRFPVLSLIDKMKEYQELQPYFNPDAVYDDAIFIDVPYSVMQNLTGLSMNDLEKMQLKSEEDPYNGAILFSERTFTVFGASD